MTQHYSSSSKILHWSMALLILSMLAVGFSMVQSLATWQAEALLLHKSFGILVLVLVFIRLLNRLLHEAPALPDDLPLSQKLAAKATQAVLYLLMFAIPISGMLMQQADGRPVSFFGLFTMPMFINADITLYAIFREFHGYAATVFLSLIALHMCAALYHGLIRRDDVLSSMSIKVKPD